MAQYYTGLDVSMEQTNITTVNDKGKIVFETAVKTNPQSIDAALKQAGFPIQKMSLESGSWSHWLVKEISALGWNITCIDARSISPLLALNTNKTDRNDARGIAEAVRIESKSIREVYQKSQESINLAVLLTTRRMLVAQRTALGNTARGLLKTFGLRLETLKSNNFSESLEAKIAEEWSESTGSSEEYPVLALKTLARSFETLRKEIKDIDNILRLLSKQDDIVKRLMTVPGVGALTAITYKVVIDSPKRFKKPRLVGAYLGMCPRQYSSGQVKRQGRISKKGSGELRMLLASSGMKILTHCKEPSKLRIWGLKISEKHGKKKASMALGRKIAIIMHHIWSKDTLFIS